MATTKEGVDLDKILDKIQKLLTLADHPETPENEAEAARARAEKLMMDYRIEESQLLRSDEGVSSLGIETKKIDVCEYSSEFKNEYWSLFYWVAAHCGLRIMSEYANGDDQKLHVFAVMVGYSSDIRFARLMYLNTRLQFATKLEPTKDPSLSDAENVYNMRNAGMEFSRIAMVMYGQEKGDGVQRRAQALYKRECEIHGEDPKNITNGSSAKTYRTSYAMGFVNEIYSRLARMRAAAGVDGTGELVLANRKENVDEAFYEKFPHMRPDPTTGSTGRVRRRMARTYKMPKTSMAGLVAGQKAAAEVDFTRMQSGPRRRLTD